MSGENDVSSPPVNYDDVRKAKHLLDSLYTLAKQVQNCESCKQLRKDSELVEKEYKRQTLELDRQIREAKQDAMFCEASLEQEREISKVEVTRLKKELEAIKLECETSKVETTRLKKELNESKQAFETLKKRTRDAISLMCHGTVQ
jgi:hypothetical protein